MGTLHMHCHWGLGPSGGVAWSVMGAGLEASRNGLVRNQDRFDSYLRRLECCGIPAGIILGRASRVCSQAIRLDFILSLTRTLSLL